MKRPLRWTLLAGLALLLSVVGQAAFNLTIKSLPQRPAEAFDSGGAERLLYYFDVEASGKSLPEGIELSEAFMAGQLEGCLRYIRGRYDVADFRMNSLVRLYLGHGQRLPAGIQASIKDAMLGFKYWMDQGGADSMCYWSENHQILFASEEYLVGQSFPDEIFAVDGKSGREHMAMAKARIEAWMEQRFLYGFTEWHSNNYYPEDIAPMANIIQFADDDALRARMKIVMDLIWMDLATQSWKYRGRDEEGKDRDYYVFVSSSGRMYSDNRVSDELGNRLRPFLDYALQPEETAAYAEGWSQSRNGFFICFKQMLEARDASGRPYYALPAVIRSIFNDEEKAISLKSSQGLNVEELAGEALLGQADPQIMMQFNMEAFTNPPVIDNTLRYLAKHRMFTNDFLNDFKLVNLWPLRAFGLLKAVSSALKPATDGVAIERANVYSYKTPYYSLHNAQAHQAGAYADQQAISSANLSYLLSVFTSQPAKIARRSGTPSYWTGNGRQPYSVQEKNALLAIYLPPREAGFMEAMVVPDTTHAYFPLQFFDETDLSRLGDGYAFGRAGRAYIALKARHGLAFTPFSVSAKEGDTDDMLKRGSPGKILAADYDLVQRGPGAHYFIIELSSSDRESFEAFKARIAANPVAFDPALNALDYQSVLDGEDTPSRLRAEYGVSFSVDGETQDLDYGRYENPYVPGGYVERKAGTLRFEHKGAALSLDFTRG
ncbi:MAG TPA: hypothetical protein DCG47_13105, partial [Spirochaetaceae bacterium]|nr:hypothetical protein [Spirochaetaceae bacterium]